VETLTLQNHKPFTIIICMLPAMSELLLRTQRPTIDTSFKRAACLQEFEIEAWFSEIMKCKYCRTAWQFIFADSLPAVVCCRAFTTSQSATAHLTLFRLIFKIAQLDTNQQVQFRHIHGEGFEIFSADAHKGQALGR